MMTLNCSICPFQFSTASCSWSFIITPYREPSAVLAWVSMEMGGWLRQAQNTHDSSQCEPLACPNTTYWLLSYWGNSTLAAPTLDAGRQEKLLAIHSQQLNRPRHSTWWYEDIRPLSLTKTDMLYPECFSWYLVKLIIWTFIIPSHQSCSCMWSH